MHYCLRGNNWKCFWWFIEYWSWLHDNLVICQRKSSRTHAD